MGGDTNPFEKFRSHELEEGEQVGDRAERFRKGDDVMGYGPSRYVGPRLVPARMRLPLRALRPRRLARGR